MLEREFATKFRAEMREQYTANGRHFHLVTLYDAPRSGKKPYDSYMLDIVGFSALEFKMCKGASFSMSSVSERQVTSLNEVIRCHGNGYVIAYIDRTKQVMIINMKMWDKLSELYHDRIPLSALPSLCQQMFITLLDRKKVRIGSKSTTRWNILEWK